MKKILSFILTICSLFFIGQGGATATAAQNDDYANYKTYVWLEQFVGANPSRTTGTVGESAAADWLADKLQGLGYAVQNQPFEAYVYGVSGVADGVRPSRNVIAQKQTQVQKSGTVIIGAHYDNAASISNGAALTGGNGAGDNGSGVAVALTLAQKFLDFDLPFDVKFVFFGAEEMGMLGSRAYVQSLTQAQRDDILLMINVDTVAAGDYVYVWGEDIANPQTDYFLSQGGGKITKTPANKRSVFLNTMSFRPYYNTAHASDSTSFLQAKIPVAFFFSGNLSSSSFGFVENEGKNDMMHTPNDTVQYMKDTYGIKFVHNMEAVVGAVYDGVAQNPDDFAEAVKYARNYIVGDFWLNPLYAYMFLFVFIAAAAFFAYRYYKKLQKQAILGTPDVKKDKIFSKPDDDDIFTYRS